MHWQHPAGATEHVCGVVCIVGRFLPQVQHAAAARVRVAPVDLVALHLICVVPYCGCCTAPDGLAIMQRVTHPTC
jgi:hypothetical protein